MIESVQCAVCQKWNSLADGPLYTQGFGYMVKDSVWQKEAGQHEDNFVHLDCLERHLGRELGPDDFTEAPLNYFGYIPKHKLKPAAHAGIIIQFHKPHLRGPHYAEVNA